VVRSAERESSFVEGTGVGFIAEGMLAALQRSGTAHPDTSAQVMADLYHYRDTLMALQPRRFDIGVDGLDLSGDYILVEVLNMPCVGPNIVLASDVGPFDGFLSVVIAGEEQRSALLSYFEERLAGHEAGAPLLSTRARSVELRGASVAHIDDEIQHVNAATAVFFGIDRAAVHVLS
jgi:hypothetical protein